jgi:hypothetical protein
MLVDHKVDALTEEEDQEGGLSEEEVSALSAIVRSHPDAERRRIPMPEDMPLRCPNCGSKTIWLDVVQIEVEMSPGVRGIIGDVEAMSCDDCGTSTRDSVPLSA